MNIFKFNKYKFYFHFILMIKLTTLKRSFSLTPFAKGISRLGINTDRLVFNPTYFFIYLEYLNYIKLHSLTNRHQILLLVLLLYLPMERYVHIQV